MLNIYFSILLLLFTTGSSKATTEAYTSELSFEHEKTIKSCLIEFGQKNYTSLKLALKKTPQMMIGSCLIAFCLNNILMSSIGEEAYLEIQEIENTYEDSVFNEPIRSIFIKPILEEFLFRMTMIPFIKQRGESRFYRLQNHFMRCYSSILFAKIHWNNPHPGRIIQTIGAGATGIMYYNLLEEDLTIGGAKTASIYAHIINNSLIMLAILSVH